MTLEELQKMTVVTLREEAMKLPNVKGVSAMKKDQLIELLSEKFGIETKKKAEAIPADKSTIKKEIKELKAMKQEAIAKKDYESAILYRKKIRTHKRRLRKVLKSSSSVTG